MLGYETRATVAAELNIGSGFGDSKKGGQVSGANFGASAAAGIERQYAVRVERMPESDAMFVQQKVVFTKQMAASAGLGIGGSVALKRVIEITQKLQMSADGVQLGDSGTTVKFAVDGKLMAALGVIVTGQAGVGGEFTLEMRLADLLAFGQDAIDTLLGDDDQKIVAMLRAVPIKVEARGRYEAGVAIGFSIDLDGVFKGGIGCSVMMIDRATGWTYTGGEGAAADPQGFEALAGGLRQPLQGAISGTQERLTMVTDEVRGVTQAN
jgi:hypothetical protein